MSPDQTARQTPIVLDKFPALALPALYRAAIGPINTTYYLKRFTQFETEGRVGASWNWAASLNTINWLLFRKLGLPLLAYLVTAVALVVFVAGTGRLILHWPSSTEWAAWAVLAATLFALPGSLGNGWFYRQCRRDIERAIQASPTLEDACQKLSKQASTRARLWRIATVNLGALAIGLALVWIPMPRSPQPEKTPDNAPAPLRQPTNASAPVNAAVPARMVVPANAADVAAPPPAASLSDPTPQDQLTGALPVAPLVTKAPASALAKHYVNVGLFADPDNARRAYVKLVKAGLPASRELMMLRQQRVTRVRCGPFDSRDAALAAVKRIRALALDAVLAKPETTNDIAGSTQSDHP